MNKRNYMEEKKYTYDELENINEEYLYASDCLYDEDGEIINYDIRSRSFTKKIKQNEFHLRKNKTMKLVCSNCNTDEFQVGQDIYFTMIRCKKCGFEECVHEG